MNRDEIFDGRGGHGNFRVAAARNRKRREKSKRQMRDRGAKFGAIRAVPGIDGVERFEFGDARVVEHAKQVEPGVGDGAGAIDGADQRQNRAGSPDLGVVGARRFHFRKPEDHVANGAGPDQESAVQDYFRPYSLRAFSRSTMRASSTARSREISLSRTIPVSAMPSASRPVTLAIQPASSQPASGGAKG